MNECVRNLSIGNKNFSVHRKTIVFMNDIQFPLTNPYKRYIVANYFLRRSNSRLLHNLIFNINLCFRSRTKHTKNHWSIVNSILNGFFSIPRTFNRSNEGNVLEIVVIRVFSHVKIVWHMSKRIVFFRIIKYDHILISLRIFEGSS